MQMYDSLSFESSEKPWQKNIIWCQLDSSLFDPKICQGFEVPKKSGIFKELPSRWPDLCYDTVVERIIRGREEYLTRNKDRARREDFGDYG